MDILIVGVLLLIVATFVSSNGGPGTPLRVRVPIR